jgi:hypothetical protein
MRLTRTRTSLSLLRKVKCGRPKETISACHLTKSFFILNSSSRTIESPPTLSLTCGRRVAENVTGVSFRSPRQPASDLLAHSFDGLSKMATFRTGAWHLGPWGRDLVRQAPPSFTISFAQAGGWSIEAQTAPARSHIGVEWSTKVLSGVKVRVGAVAATDGTVNTTLGGERRLTENSRLSLELQFGLGGGVTFRIRYPVVPTTLIFAALLTPLDFSYGCRQPNTPGSAHHPAHLAYAGTRSPAHCRIYGRAIHLDDGARDVLP